MNILLVSRSMCFNRFSPIYDRTPPAIVGSAINVKIQIRIVKRHTKAKSIGCRPNKNNACDKPLYVLTFMAI